VNDCGSGTSFEGAAEWAAASQPARSKVRKARYATGPRPGVTPIGPSRQDVALAWVVVAALAVVLLGCAVWGALERSAEARREEPRVFEIYVPPEAPPEAGPPATERPTVGGPAADLPTGLEEPGEMVEEGDGPL
jgi:hypothetical protein